MVTGRRHGFEFDFDVGFDDDGRVLGVEIDLIANAGFSADLSPPVMTRAICHFDNAYWLPHVAMHGYCARTNTQSNTAFRGFGGPQGAIAIEFILDSIARRLGKDPLDVRRANYYGTTRPQRHALRPDGRGQHHRTADRAAAGHQRLPRAPAPRSRPSTPPARCSSAASR